MPHLADPRPAHLVLREETRAAHEDTEASGGMRRLMAGELDDAGYDGLLRAQLALYDAWEAEREVWLRGAVADAGWAYVSRARLLREDLGIAHIVGSYTAVGQPRGASVGAHDVGDPHHAITPHPPAITALPTSTSTSTSTAWGELYVVEGSSLGGRLIARRLRELYPHREHRFYAVGEEAPSAWRRFQHLLDTHLPDDASCGAAVDGATRMFARFRRTLKEPTDV